MHAPAKRSRHVNSRRANAGVSEDDPIEVLDPNMRAWNGLHRLGISTLGELDRLDVSRLVGVRGVARMTRKAIESLQGQTRALLQGATGPGALELRLAAAGIDLDTPWEECLGVLSGRGRRFLDEAGVHALRDIARALDSGLAPPLTRRGSTRPWTLLPRLRFVGHASIRDVRNCVESLCDIGMDRHVFGPKGRPSTLDALVDRMLERSEPRRRMALTLRVVEGRFLLDVADALDCSTSRVQMLIADVILDLTRRFGRLAREMTVAVRAALAEGEPLDAEAVRGLCGSRDPRRACVALRVAGASARVDRAGRLVAVRSTAARGSPAQAARDHLR